MLWFIISIDDRSCRLYIVPQIIIICMLCIIMSIQLPIKLFLCHVKQPVPLLSRRARHCQYQPRQLHQQPVADARDDDQVSSGPRHPYRQRDEGDAALADRLFLRADLLHRPGAAAARHLPLEARVRVAVEGHQQRMPSAHQLRVHRR